jgi:MSHA biogenesis protein MshJ
MDALKQTLKKWSMRIDALSLRERVLVFLAAAGVTLSLVFLGLIEPVLKQQEQMLQKTLGLQQEISALRAQLADNRKLNRPGIDDALEGLYAEARMIEQQVQVRENGLISPDKMISVLRILLDAHPGLSLLELETEAAQPVLAATMSEAAGGATPALLSGRAFYKHAVTLRLQGSYAELTAYVARLERQPWTVQWESVRLDANQHPRLELTLKLNTLSREPTWARL